MLLPMSYTQFAPGGRKAAERLLRYEPVRPALPFLTTGQPDDNLPVIQL